MMEVLKAEASVNAARLEDCLRAKPGLRMDGSRETAEASAKWRASHGYHRDDKRQGQGKAG
jgi:hypothetical protein